VILCAALPTFLTQAQETLCHDFCLSQGKNLLVEQDLLNSFIEMNKLLITQGVTTHRDVLHFKKVKKKVLALRNWL
jgi:hypothetical protein